MFPLWMLQILVIGALMLCCIGVAALILFLFIDSRDQQIW